MPAETSVSTPTYLIAEMWGTNDRLDNPQALRAFLAASLEHTSPAGNETINQFNGQGLTGIQVGEDSTVVTFHNWPEIDSYGIITVSSLDKLACWNVLEAAMDIYQPQQMGERRPPNLRHTQAKLASREYPPPTHHSLRGDIGLARAGLEITKMLGLNIFDPKSYSLKESDVFTTGLTESHLTLVRREAIFFDSLTCGQPLDTAKIRDALFSTFFARPDIAIKEVPYPKLGKESYVFNEKPIGKVINLGRYQLLTQQLEE